MKALVASTFIPFLVGALGLVSVSDRAVGQLSVGPSGLAPQTFDALPAVSQWPMTSVGPRVAGGVFTSGI
jgi:hypothetical protein